MSLFSTYYLIHKQISFALHLQQKSKLRVEKGLTGHSSVSISQELS